MNMEQEFLTILDELSNLVGISGREWEVARYIKQSLTGYVDSIEVMPTGSLIVRKKGVHPGPKAMYCAHMDEVGYVVKRVTEDGFLIFDRIGFVAESCLPGRRVLVQGSKGVVNGVVGIRPNHLQTDGTVQNAQNSYVDLGVSSREDVEAMGVGLGSQIVPESTLTQLNGTGYYLTRAADDRACCAILIKALQTIRPEDIHGEVCVVFNVMEETALKGTCAAVNRLCPDYGVFLDTIPSGDVPDVNFENELPIATKKGPVIVLEQAGVASDYHAVSHPRLVDAAIQSCHELGIDYQQIVINNATYLTDAVTAQNCGNGIAIISMVLPRRYAHSPNEMFHISDAMKLQRLVEHYMTLNIDLTFI